ncbi:U4/U6-U5 snRNP complex subunit PRP3 [Sporobolomyces salmoneus]|uniref:U4/U6-U5 snRNP complex subunit PRP3 n=1 Tax=Sporobolomyces salmoneus TaxID=183962 RepID=UPI0031828893
MSDRKRPNVFGDQDAINGSPNAKKLKGQLIADLSLLPSLLHCFSRNAPAAPSFKPTPIAPTPLPQSNVAGAVDIAAKQAEIRAKLAAMKAKLPGLAGPPGSAPPPSSLPSAPVPSSSGPPRSNLPAVPGLPKPNVDPELARKIAEAKRKVEEMAARNQAAKTKVNPYLSASFQGREKEPSIDPSIAARGGLSMAAHPLLMDLKTPAAEQSKKDRYKPMAPKFSTVKANARLPARSSTPSAPSTSGDAGPDSLKETPFFDTRLSHTGAGVSGKIHMGRGHARNGFTFKQPGTYVKQGEALRAEARMEDLKRRITESSMKAGLQSDLEETAKKVRRPPPPEVEWWDEAYLPEKTYDSVTSEALDNNPLISHLVQHPISIPAPNEKNQVALKPLFLTKKEMKKMRRMRRQAELKDKQDRQKMGLLPPDPPKVKISNMMRVLTQDAIADPTKVEAQVRREMALRERKHLKDNETRKLTPEEKRAKTEEKYVKDESKGIQAIAFKIRYLSDPSHKFKVKKNAIDDHLTGVICHNPKFCLVVVEGGAKSIKHYRQLMLNRIRWTEESAPRANDPAKGGSVEPEASSDIPRPAGPFNDDEEAPPSLADNYCKLVWEGIHRERMFPDIRNANCPAESHAREALGKLAMLWDVAKVEEKDEFDY